MTIPNKTLCLNIYTVHYYFFNIDFRINEFTIINYIMEYNHYIF